MRLSIRNFNYILAGIVFLFTFAIYAATVEPSASFWDCPEYITNAAMLEIGHPPGNPTWMLFAHFASLLAPSNSLIPLFINLSSALFTALAALSLYLSFPLLLSLGRPSHEVITDDTISIRNSSKFIASAVAALSFAFLDSTWFSAVEAEVYAFSIFCTALCLLLTLRWTRNPRPATLILIAYITGLSIGVHQLNLLCIPALTLIILFASHKRPISFFRTCGWLALSFLIIAAILFGIMPGMVALAQKTELCVIQFGTPFNTGLIIYTLFSILFVAASALITARSRSPLLVAFLIAVSLFLSGATSLGGNLLLGALLAVIIAILFLLRPQQLLRHAVTSLWALAFIMLGFSTYGVIILRANANPPMNQGNPSDIFAFASYLGRDQYGSTPLFYGRTPHSFILRQENIRIEADGDTVADYSSYAKEKRDPKIFKAVPGGKIINKSGFMSAKDSAFNQRQFDSFANHYVIADYNVEYEYTPQLNMFLPRIVSNNPDHLEAYESWIGMTDSSLVKVEADEAVDSLGNTVGKLDPVSGVRHTRKSSRPSYMQNLEVLASYQVAYMYLRYLLWNFAGRQNDIPSQGQVDAGNFITGFNLIDNAMIGNVNAMPEEYGTGNPGHNRYFLIPLILALLGMFAQISAGRSGDRQFYVILLLFFMTGIAIVLYLNQSPCEPRERDYSFIGSFYAFSFWIAYGAEYILSRCRWRGWFCIAILAVLSSPAILLAQNYDDHNRAGRTITSDMAYNTLQYLDNNAIIFVNGDNFTFPLWYSQEVEGVRQDVRIINLAYLSTEWYPRQLLLPTRSASPLPLFASDANLAYNTLSSALIPSDTIPVDARKSFLYMYNSSPASGFRFPSSRIKIPAASGDSIIIDLKKVSGGKASLMKQNIMILDIIASNAYREHPASIYWSAALPDSHKASLAPYIAYDGLVSKLNDTIVSHNPASHNNLATFLATQARYGNLIQKGRWLDEPGIGQVRMLRRALRISASELLEQQKPDEALALIRIHLDSLPDNVAPFSIYNDRYIVRDEAVEIAQLLFKTADMLNNPDLRRQGFAILKKEINTLARWRNYYNLLPPRLRGVTSPTVSAAISNLYAPIDAYYKEGGDSAFILSHPLLKVIDLKNEKRQWTIRQARRQLLRDARYPVSTDSTLLHLKEYYNAGGTKEDLLKYTEISRNPLFPIN